MDIVPIAPIDIDFSQAAKRGDLLLEDLRRLRELDPIFWSARQGAWIVTGHQEAMEAFSGDLPLSVTRFQTLIVSGITPEAREARIPYLMKTLPSWVVNVDAPVHTRLRKLMVKAFSRKIAEDIRPFAREAIKRAFDEAEAAGGEVEFVEDVARRIPGRVILRLLGLPDSLLPRLRKWSLALNGALGGQPVNIEIMEKCQESVLEMREIFLEEIEDRRVNPRDDFISLLVHAREDDDRMTEEEVLGVLYVTLIAGHDTTMNTMVMGTAALARNTEARTYIRANPDRTPDVILEIMRYIAMAFTMVRSVKEDFEWRGHQMKRDQFIFVTMAGANRDPSIWQNPDRLDFDRPQDKNMTFAPGMHHCIGHLLAKMQLGEFFPELLRRFEPQVLDETLNWGVSIGFRGLETLNVKLHPAPGTGS